MIVIAWLSKPFTFFFFCFAVSLCYLSSKSEVSGFQSSAEIALKRRTSPTIRYATRCRFQFFTDQSHAFSDSLQRRLSADPSFIQKSMAEVTLAALTQLLAEIGRRGKNRILPEFDFVLAGLLTAVAGKYYSMWKVAPTASNTISTTGSVSTSQSKKERNLPMKASPIIDSWWEKVPTNAFQNTCIDGSYPTLLLRLASFIKPIPSLFFAGFISSLFGYGITAGFIALRSLLLPYHISQTQTVNILSACLYTGTFIAVVSNMRYQLLSGIIEPKIIDPVFKDRHHPSLHGSIILLVRSANGYVGSFLAIAGMRWLGLQRLK